LAAGGFWFAGAFAAGETQTDIARSYNVSHLTIGRLQGAMLRPFEDAAVVA
jgi:hypothetical protein